VYVFVTVLLETAARIDAFKGKFHLLFIAL
jgi:hypothetical protein